MSRLQKLMQVLLVLVIMLATALPLGAAFRPSPRTAQIQPLLAQMAAEAPDELVRVIVQKNGAADEAEQLVTGLGGSLLVDLPLINAFAAELPGSQVMALEGEDAVKWVSLDAPVVSTQASQSAVFTTWAAEASKTTPDANLLSDDFKNDPIAAGHTLWFNSFVKVDKVEFPASTVFFEDVTITFSANGETYRLPVPDGQVTISSAAALATTIFDEANGRWVSIAPDDYENKEVFLTGLAYQVPESLPGGIKDVTWSGHFTSDSTLVEGEWRWSAAVYSTFGSDYNALGIKPLKDDKANPYLNNDPVGTPENFKSFLVSGGTGDGGDKYVGDFTTGADTFFRFQQGEAMVDAVGPDDIYGFGSRVVGGFAGLHAEVTPGFEIDQVEFVVKAYAPAEFNHDVKLTIISPSGTKTKNLKHEAFESHIGAANAGIIYIDVTDAWDWDWSHFDADLEILIDQSGLDPDEMVYYDAVGLRVSSVASVTPAAPSAPVLPPADDDDDDEDLVDASQLLNAYNAAVRATDVWNEGPAHLQGQGVTVAVVDSGIGRVKDLGNRVYHDINFNKDYHDSKDRYGHGTFVASIIGGDGKHSKGEYMGIAPEAMFLNLRVTSDEGMGYESDIVSALQWLYENKDDYNVRVVNLSLNSSVAQDYNDSPLCAAVEMLWFSGVVVVVSAGNNGTAELYPPANDPYVITVGATDDFDTVSISDDVVASFSAYGVTEAGVSKPDLVAPGTDLITYLPKNGKLTVGKEHPNKKIDNNYFQMSGTSMAAPIVTGAVALLLQDEPGLTPDQVKYRLMDTARTDWAGYDSARAGAGYLDIYAAVHGTSTQAANQGAIPHQLLAKMALIAFWASQNGDESIDWENVDWSSVNWNSVNWNSVNWNSVNWNSVNWNSVNWNSVNWNSVNWNSVNWNSVNWNSVNWNSVNWNSVNWNSVNWNSDHWGD